MAEDCIPSRTRDPYTPPSDTPSPAASDTYEISPDLLKYRQRSPLPAKHQTFDPSRRAASESTLPRPQLRSKDSRLTIGGLRLPPKAPVVRRSLTPQSPIIIDITSSPPSDEPPRPTPPRPPRPPPLWTSESAAPRPGDHGLTPLPSAPPVLGRSLTPPVSTNIAASSSALGDEPTRPSPPNPLGSSPTSLDRASEEPWHCPNRGCTLIFPTEKIMKAHHDEAHRCWQLECPNPKCSYRFPNTHSLDLHVKKCLPGHVVMCQECLPKGWHASVFAGYVELDLHRVQVHGWPAPQDSKHGGGDSKIQCTWLCGESFASKKELRQHLTTGHKKGKNVKKMFSTGNLGVTGRQGRQG